MSNTRHLHNHFSALLGFLAFGATACTAGVLPLDASPDGSGASAGQSSGSSSSNSAANQADAGTTGSAQGPAYSLSNVEVPAAKGEGDVVVSSHCELDGDSGKIGCALPGTYSTFTYQQKDGDAVTVFVAKSFRIDGSGSLAMSGGHPVVLFAYDTIDISGNVSGTGLGGHSVTPAGTGGGPGGGGAPFDTFGPGGGGGFCGKGGVSGAKPGAAPVPGGVSYGTPELSPLVAGSAGGDASSSTGATGGGALQLSAGKSIDVKAGSTIAMSGVGAVNGGGGGSGGAILFEAPSVRIRGLVAVNGGSGSMNGEAGQSGQPSTAAAQGPRGISGSDATHVDGYPGVAEKSTNTAHDTGGGGGAGRIRINTSTGVADLDGATFSPALSTPCTTQGKLH